MTTLTRVTDLVVTSCWCGIALAIPDSLYKEAQRNHKLDVYCPLGHTFVYSGDTEADRLRKENQRLRDRITAEQARAEGAEASLRTTKGVVTKLRKRVTTGACPFGCRRHFVNLERHVASKHPGATLPGEE